MWQNFIDYCNDGHQIVFFTVMVIFWAICYFITIFELWLSDKMTKAVNITYMQTLRSSFIHNGDFDIFNVLPYIIFSPAFCATSTIIFVFSIIYWIVHKIMRSKHANS